VDSHGPRWSSDVHQADWIAERLTPWDEYRITMLVPAGFEAYARVLHPVDTPEDGGRLVRWADVAAWSGMPLRKDAQFHSIALPPAGPAGPPPFGGHAPQEGTLYTADAEAIAAITRAWTATPDECWFCVWDGFGWDHASVSAVLTENGQPPEIIGEPRRDPVPAAIRAGPRVRLPNREYLLYQGPAEAVTATAGIPDSRGQCANLCWPADHAWCVASEIDLPWTYVGGPRGLIGAILADDRIEALPAAPDDPVSRVEDWVAAWADDLVDGLLARGEASVRTPRGTVDARLRRPGRRRRVELHIQTTGTSGGYDGGAGYGLLDDGADLRSELTLQLTLALLDLASI
jgi:hypothetical protein